MGRVAIVGAAGRMGRMLLAATAKHPELSVGAAVDRVGSAAIGTDVSVLEPSLPAGVRLADTLESVIEQADVVIDFSLPESTLQTLALCQAYRRPLVIGTTGFDAAQKGQIQHAAERVPVVFAANYSVGVTLSLALLRQAAQALGDSVDIEIIEAHHRHKVDAPSGTALAMGEAVAQTLGRDLAKCAVYGREGRTGERDRQTIGFETIRGGDIVGEHTVMFIADGERLEITHKASSRSNFADGAVRAAHWVRQQPAGLYSMEHVLGLADSLTT